MKAEAAVEQGIEKALASRWPTDARVSGEVNGAYFLVETTFVVEPVEVVVVANGGDG